MTTISKIQGISDPALMGQVEAPAQPDTDIPDSSTITEIPEPKNSESAPKAAETVQSDPKPSFELTYEEIEIVAGKLQSRINDLANEPHRVAIRQDNETKQVIIEIINPDGEVVKQFPSEKVLNLHRRMDDLSGMVIDEMI